MTNNRYIKSNGSWIPLVKTKDILIKQGGSWIPYKTKLIDNQYKQIYNEQQLSGLYETNSISFSTIISDENMYMRSTIDTSNWYPLIMGYVMYRLSDTHVIGRGYILCNGQRIDQEYNYNDPEPIPLIINNSSEAIELAKEALLEKSGVIYNNYTIASTYSNNYNEYINGSYEVNTILTRYVVSNTDTGRSIVVMSTGQVYVDYKDTVRPQPAACLTGDTLIKIPNKYIPIKSLKVGDIVLSYNKTTRIVEEKEIYKTYCHRPNRIYEITLETGDIINATFSHRFYTDKGILDTRELSVGDYLTDINENNIEIVDIKTKDNYENVYEIWIKDNNNYFITNNDILSSCEDIN